MEERPQRETPCEQHEPDRQGADRDRRTDPRGAEIEATGRQRTGQHQERDEREILEQQHAERDPTVGAVDLRLLGQLLDEDRGRADRDRTAERHRREQIDSEGVERERGAPRHQQHLHAADAEHLATHRDHARPGELQAEREQQEHHAELREQLRALGLIDESERIRPHGDTDEEITQYRRQPDSTGERDDTHR